MGNMHKSNATVKARSFTKCNLKAGRCSNTAEVRLLRFWEARNVRKGRELMSLDMLLLDEQINSTTLCNLKAGRCSNTAEVRLLRFWEARNVRKAPPSPMLPQSSSITGSSWSVMLPELLRENIHLREEVERDHT
ncbi:hypothetical protein F2Q69_00028997 [Brassica cretica]|uniref:Uncharacterized protein n=1 Tax=Brassica cretica TaxID=69181 RepID=A0A8S9S446_BRACR|nr:hypothetical protein F2Q69_00028997 [Brassica cretica]